MSDERLRELERRWQETGADEDEAAYLLARLRAGELDVERLKLAAYCDYAAAQLALGDEAPPTPSDLDAWGRGMHVWGKEACVRAVVALARVAFPYWRGHPEDVPAEAFRAAENWIVCPCREHAAEARQREFLASFGNSPLHRTQARVLSRAARAAAYPSRASARGISVVAELTQSLPGVSSPIFTIREELVPWALGMEPPTRRHASSSRNPSDT